MLSINNSNKSQVCKINKGEYENKIIRFMDNYDTNRLYEKKLEYKPFKSFKLQDEQAYLTPENNSQIERECVLILARSGAGKTYFCRQYIESYHINNPKNAIYIISPFEDDYQNYDYINYIKIDENYMKNPIVLTSFKKGNCLVVIDDLDVMEIDKNIRKSINVLEKQIIMGGRHLNISIVKTSHSTSTKDIEIRQFINECHILVLYLKTASNYKTILDNYLGFNTKEINYLKKLNTRWIAIKPLDNIIYTQHEIFFKNDFI